MSYRITSIVGFMAKNFRSQYPQAVAETEQPAGEIPEEIDTQSICYG